MLAGNDVSFALVILDDLKQITYEYAMRPHVAGITCFLVLSTLGAFAQTEDKDPVAVVEIGGATDWNVAGGAAAFGGDLAVEVTPIENWLELEMGTSPSFTHHSTEWDTDLLFKKPWTLSPEMRSSCVALDWNGFTQGRQGKHQTPLAEK